MTVLRTLQLWLTTALRAAPVLTVFMCLTTILSSVLNPLSIYGVSLAVAAAGRNASLWPGILLAGGCLLVSAMAANVSYPISDTVDDKVYRHVHDDLLRLTADVPTIAHHEDPALADRLALVQRDAHELGGIYRLLTTVGAVTGSATVIALLWSVGPGLSLLLVVAAVPSVVHGLGQYRRNALWKGNERFRRVAHKAIDVLSDPRQGVEVRCFGLSKTLTAVASEALGMRNRPWMAVTSRYAKLTALGWLAFGLSYALAVVWLLQRVRHGSAGVGDLSLLLLIGPQVVTTGQGISANVRMILGALQTFGRYQWLREYSASHTTVVRRSQRRRSRLTRCVPLRRSGGRRRHRNAPRRRGRRGGARADDLPRRAARRRRRMVDGHDGALGSRHALGLRCVRRSRLRERYGQRDPDRRISGAGVGGDHRRTRPTGGHRLDHIHGIAPPAGCRGR